MTQDSMPANGLSAMPADIAESALPVNPDDIEYHKITPMIAVLMVFIWVIFAATINHSQFGDHFEQYTWSHSLEWGYHKHPPLPTWLLGGAIKIFGPSVWWAYALSALFNAGTAALTFLIARTLLGTPIAALAIVLWGLHHGFSARAQLWNHNTAMIFCTAASTWLVMQAVRTRALHMWLAAGIFGGLAMLSKYQALIPLFGISVALWHGGTLRQKVHRRGLACALVAAVLVFLPHLHWVVMHDFSPLKYASQGDHAELSLPQRLGSMIGFVAIQLRMLFPVWVCLGLAALWLRRRRTLTAGLPSQSAPMATRITPGDPLFPRRSWSIGLFFVPVTLVLGACLLLGLKLQDHWGYQTMQFVSILLAWHFRRLLQLGLQRWWVLAMMIHLLSMAVYAQAVLRFDGDNPDRRTDQFYPARALAESVLREWQATTTCPLKYVVGPTFEAGMVSVYSGQNPQILENDDPALSPWIDMQELHRTGAVYVETHIEDPTARQGVFSFALSDSPSGTHRTREIHWAIVAPQSCPPR